MNNRAQELAQAILKKTTKRNQIVGLCLPRSVELMVGVLGILKAGCAYLPLDPEYPLERLEFMLKDTEAALMVTNNDLTTKFKETKIGKTTIEEVKGENNKEAISLPQVKKQDTAYIIYTSGSTGTPKGVPISHQNILSSTLGRLEFYDNIPSSFLLLSSIAFDSSKAGIFWTLCTGGKLVISEDKLEQDVERLCEIISNQEVTHTLLLPSLYYVILQYANIELLRTLNSVIVAGEACTTEMVNRHFEELPTVHLYNEYGPTEATVWCIAHKIRREDTFGAIPIGRPVAGSQIVLLDDQMELVPKGAVGEIYVGGQGLSSGYIKRPELTGKAFLTNPNSEQGTKVYKTGDLARYNADENLEFFGRKDHQVKIRGHRIELDEIKNIALQQENITEAEVCVVANNDVNQIYLYVSLANTKLESNLDQVLTKKLPKYMVPAKVIKLDSFPKLPNGKNDLGELLKIEAQTTRELNRQIKDQPTTEIQEKLLEVWGNVLNQSNICINDNFFEVGGDSILSIQMISGARKMGLNFSPNNLFEHQTIAELERLIINTHSKIKNEHIAYVGPIPLSPIQKWFFKTHLNAPHYWNQAFEIEYPSPKEVARVREAFEYVVKNHDALRTRFHINAEQINAEIASDQNLSGFETYELNSRDQITYDYEIDSIKQKVQQETDLGKSSLFKCLYFQNDKLKNYKIVVIAHHLVIDVISWQIILNDFKAVLNNGKNMSIVQTSSIKDWQEYLIEISTSNKILTELDFWQAQSVDYELPTDLSNQLPIKESSVNTVNYVLDKDCSHVLTSIANEAYNTKTDELLLTAFIAALCQLTGSKEISIALEKHGRESLETDFDLSRTVGWFTSFFPIKFYNSLNGDYAKDITGVKEKLRSVPNGGSGFGILKQLTPKLDSIDYPQVVFNFLGTKTETDFKFLTKDVRQPSSERHYFLEANLQLEKEKLVMKLSYSSENYNIETIQNLISQFDTI
ncbi:MAG: amino acid adenylation domain-containing protein, partial [Maribacter sp.]